MSIIADVPGPRARRWSLIASVIGGLIILAGLIWIVVFLAQPRINAGGVEVPGMFDPSRLEILGDRAMWRSIGRGLLGTMQMAVVAAVFALGFGIR